MLYICSTYEEDVYKKFTKDKNGLYYNKRMEDETIKRVNYSQSRRENINKRYDKKKPTYVVHMENENENININDNINDNINETANKIIDDLNLILGTNYKKGSRKNKELINARIAEGFILDDFKTVHRKMFNAWGVDDKMRQYLRPITLYSNKFDSYLNRPEDLKMSTAGSKTALNAMKILEEDLKC